MPAKPLIAPICPLCGKPNECAVAATGSFEAACWCTQVRFAASTLAAVPAQLQGKACICRDCALKPSVDHEASSSS